MHVFGYIMFGIAAVLLLFAGGITLFLNKTGGSQATYTKPPSASEIKKQQQAKIVCQFCQTPGGVTARRVHRAKRKTITRIGGAVVTAGASLPLTGVSKKGTVTELTCNNCGMKWDAPQAF